MERGRWKVADRQAEIARRLKDFAQMKTVNRKLGLKTSPFEFDDFDDPTDSEED